MLFLYRPRETWMPFALPRSRTEQAAYNRNLQDEFAATRRVPVPSPANARRPADRERDLAELRALRDSGALTEAEFEVVAARLTDT